MNPPEVVAEPGSDVCRTGVSVDFNAVLLGVDSDFVAECEVVWEGEPAWKDFEGEGDGETPAKGKKLLYNGQKFAVANTMDRMLTL